MRLIPEKDHYRIEITRQEAEEIAQELPYFKGKGGTAWNLWELLVSALERDL